MAPCPTNALAVNFKDFSAIIYTDKDGLVSWLNFEGPESKSPEAQYTLHNAISADKKGNIVAYEGQLALIMYHHESKAHEVNFRLYYIQKGPVTDADGSTSPDRHVRELCATHRFDHLKAGKPLEWSRYDPKDPKATAATLTPSAFDKKRYISARSSPLAAICGNKAIRVYFQKEGSNDALSVAYADYEKGSCLVQKPSLFEWKDRVAYSGSF
ncbi:uncharacterized protein PAC_03305 [Phialocephala subalpina]|uniref:Uncharacterized protein n=1 Tax=Phialocephala subalpina TaxID=576137 RepID=A0A1L7WKY3_9HELO|nr:uncharacterized protein PAC_03305 [Phialocephala subalpina]